MARSELVPGDMIASYRVVRKLGEGGMGAVYEAIQDFTQRRAAVKLLHSFRADDDYKARFMQEARALAQQDHPNVVRLIDANITPQGDIWIAMEYLEGCTLREYCHRNRQMPLEVALHHLIEICDGVAAGHEIGIVHCDLKPENVFITKQGATKVVDFGAARAPSLGVIRSTAAVIAAGGKRSVIGTPEYMSPEHLQSQGARERTDVFAIGTMAWEMLAGHHWMEKPDGSKPHIWEIVRLQIDTMPPLVSAVAPDVPEHVALLIQRAMEKDQALRWPRVADLAEALRDALARYCSELHEDPADRSSKKKWIGPGAWKAHSPPVSLPLPSPPVDDPSSRVLVRVEAPAVAPPAPVAAPPAIVPPPSVTAPLVVAASKTQELPPRTSAPPTVGDRTSAPAPPSPVVQDRSSATTPASMTVPTVPGAARSNPTVPRAVAPADGASSSRVRRTRILALGFVSGAAILAVALVVWFAQRAAPAMAEGASGEGPPDAGAITVTDPNSKGPEDAEAPVPDAGPRSADPAGEEDGGAPPADAGGTPPPPKSGAPRPGTSSAPRPATPKPSAEAGGSTTPKVTLPFGPKK